MHRSLLRASLAWAFADENLLGYVREAAYDGRDPHLHLVKKTAYEARLKLGFNV